MKSVLTAVGLEKLQCQLNLLRKKRARLVEEMEMARQEGDLAENSAYHQLREDVAVVTSQIEDLEDKLAGAKVIDGTGSDTDKVDIGNKVKVEVNSIVRNFEIVGDGEADPLNGKTSYQSPIGSGLLGKKKGYLVKIETPGGMIEYRILEIE